MDDELTALEAELRALQPAALPADLEQRAAAALEAAHQRRQRSWWLAAASLPIAAALAVLIARSGTAPENAGPDPAPAVAAPADRLKPVAAENVLYAAVDEGLVTLADGTTARRERLKYVDTITWRNPRTHASLVWTIPREELRVVPVRYQ